MPARRSYRPWAEAEEQTLRELAGAGYGSPVIAKRMDRDINSIRNKLNDLQIKLRPRTFGDE
jgi:hypothetical protein